MYDFTYLDPKTIDEALSLRARYRDNSAFIAGGTNLLYLMKRGVRKPHYLINIKSIAGLDKIHFDRERGLSIGALVRLSRLEHSDPVVRYYPMLSQSAARIASPQIRNAATAGGNLSQEVWCWYLAEGFPCWMNGGKHCYAPGGDNRYHHSVAGGFICLAVHPSDLAPALYALDASVNIASVKMSERRVGIEKLLPGFTKVEGTLKQNTLGSDEIITKIQVPPPRRGSRGVFLKYAARESFDFSLSSVAALVTLEREVCTDLRVVLGGVATKPNRADNVEAALRGKKISRELIEEASKKVFEREIPLSMNGYRIRITQELVRKALLETCDMQSEEESTEGGRFPVSYSAAP